MKKRLRYVVLFLAAASFMPDAGAQSAADRLPVIELLGNRYYVYTTKKGDSMFGVANKFGWDAAKLSELNPSAVSPFKKGAKLYYLAGASKNAQDPASSLKTSSDEIRHTVKRGETVYGIATMYDIPVETLYSLNPPARNGLAAGETLLIKESVSSSRPVNDNKAVFYTVKDGDTLYRIGKDFGVSVAAIMQANPGVSDKNFKTGTNIKIPKKGSGLSSEIQKVTESTVDAIEQQKVEKKDTWASISNRSGISEELLREANPGMTELKGNTYIAVPKIETVTVDREVACEDPREQTSEGVSQIYEDVHKLDVTEGTYTVKVAVVASSPYSNKDAEYLRGFLTGVERMKREDFRIDLNVIDGTKSSADVLEQLDAFKPTIVFLTADNDIPAYIAEYALVSQTPVVNVFDTRSQDYAENPYIVQLLTPPTLFNDNIAHYIKNKYDGRTIIFVGDPDDNDLLAESLKKLWDSGKIRQCGIDDIVPHRFQESGKYLIYGYPVNRQEVSQLLVNAANVISERPFADIATIGRPNLIVYEDVMSPAFHKANVSIPSRFYIDKESQAYKTFLMTYRQLFDRTPVKSLPLYAATGYDTASYFIPALAKERGDINRLPPSYDTVQSDFELWRTSNWSGFLNPPVFMIDFTPYDTIEKNVVSYGE